MDIDELWEDDWEDDQCIECGEIGKDCVCSLDFDDHALDEEELDNWHENEGDLDAEE